MRTELKDSLPVPQSAICPLPPGVVTECPEPIRHSSPLLKLHPPPDAFPIFHPGQTPVLPPAVGLDPTLGCGEYWAPTMPGTLRG